MEVLILKGVFFFLVLVGALITSLIPDNVYGSRISKFFARIGKTFAAGVFLGIAFLHLLPESSEKLEQIKYPLSGLIAVIAYFMMLFTERVAFTDHSLVSHGKKHTDLGCHSDVEHSDEEETKLKHVLSTRTRLYSHIEEGDGENCTTLCTEPLKQSLIEHKDKSTLSSSFFLACALSIHSVIEGITVGIQSEYGPTLSLAIAILIHKIPEALVVGITLAATAKKTRCAMILIYSFATPIGVVIGFIVGLNFNPVVEGVFLACCVGTFLYISCTEIIVEEFAVPRGKYQKYFSAAFGFAFIAALSIFEEK